MGYRRIASHLNEQGIKTPKGNLWGNNNVHSVFFSPTHPLDISYIQSTI